MTLLFFSLFAKKTYPLMKGVIIMKEAVKIIGKAIGLIFMIGMCTIGVSGYVEEFRKLTEN